MIKNPVPTLARDATRELGFSERYSMPVQRIRSVSIAVRTFSMLSAIALALFGATPGAVAEDKPAAPRVAAGTLMSANASILRREAGKTEWKPVAEKEELYTGDMLVAVPSAMIGFKSGVQLKMQADLQRTSPFPIIESAVVLHSAGDADLDFTFDRGRVTIINHKEKGSALVKVRFRDQTWDLTLAEPGASVALEAYGRWMKGVDFTKTPGPKDVPTLNVMVLALDGQTTIKHEGHTHLLKAPPGPALLQWDSIEGWEDKPQTLEKIPSWAGPSDKTTEAYAKRMATIELFRKLMTEQGVEAALKEFLKSDDPARRRFAVCGMGALDFLHDLGDTVLTTKLPDVRDNTIITIRHWLGRGPGQDAKLYKFLLEERKVPPAQAETVMHLLHSFGEAEVASPSLYELLIEYLKNDKIGIRSLAYWHLIRLAPAGRKIAYDPAGSKEELLKGYAEWKKLIPDGKLPPVEKVEEK